MLAARDNRASGTGGTGNLAGLNSHRWKSHQEAFTPIQTTTGEGQLGPHIALQLQHNMLDVRVGGSRTRFQL